MRHLIIEKQNYLHLFIQRDVIDIHAKQKNITKTYPVQNFTDIEATMYMVTIKTPVNNKLEAIAVFRGACGYDSAKWVKGEVTFQKNAEAERKYLIWECLRDSQNLPHFEKLFIDEICNVHSCIKLNPIVINRIFDASEVSFYLKQ